MLPQMDLAVLPISTVALPGRRAPETSEDAMKKNAAPEGGISLSAD